MTEGGNRPKSSPDTGHRLYAVVAAAVVFLVSWAAVAARPWVSAKPDPRLAALEQREQRLRAEARLVQMVVDERQAAYRIALKARQAQIAAVEARSQQALLATSRPAVRVVELPPLTITRTS